MSGGDASAVRGIQPGPEVGKALEQTLAAVMNGQVENRRDVLLAWLAR
ncbi:hypothetical protein [Parolsenella sp.]